jgi:hypothetical protein
MSVQVRPSQASVGSPVEPALFAGHIKNLIVTRDAGQTVAAAARGTIRITAGVQRRHIGVDVREGGDDDVGSDWTGEQDASDDSEEAS